MTTMMRICFILVLIFCFVFSACGNKTENIPGNTGETTDPGKTDPENPVLGQYDYAAHFVDIPPVIDGKGDDSAWAKAEWKPIDQVWLGGGNASQSNLTPPPEGAYSGRFKIVWTEDRLYYLAEIKDTYLSLTRIDTPYNDIYLDDCLELFINEDGLGGLHVDNNNAFAYHMSYDGVHAMDYMSSINYIARNHHVKYKIGNLDLPNKKSVDGSNVYTWEIEMKIFNKNYPVNGDVNYIPEKLVKNKMMGFAVAYCNAGASNKREYFMGSMFIDGADKNQAYRNADVFAKLYLIK